jgi:hypothetical protein
VTGSRAYTWSDEQEIFTDPLTNATRLEFGKPDFDPRPAYRRVRANWAQNERRREAQEAH